MSTLRLILGDQLNDEHSWYQHVDHNVVYIMMEIRQETDYVLHHAQKIIAIFAAMRNFATHLHANGHQVHYLAIDDVHNLQSLTDNLNALITLYRADALEWQMPDEWRLDQQLQDFACTLSIRGNRVDTEHFYSQRGDAASLFAQRNSWVMEHFYRHMRVRHQVMVSPTGVPAGGRWNFDEENRQAWPGTPWEPEDTRPIHDHSALWAVIKQAGIRSFGQPQADHFRWPINRAEALTQLEAFIQHALPHFGQFQDAMSHRAWRLFHSLLSFAMNIKLLSPRTVVERVEQAWRDGHAPIAAAEGYIRQILGWREYVRGVYWHRMPDYAELNIFKHHTPLPEWFWNGQTRMRCLASAINQSLEHAHSHHINRLMVIGNFALLAGISPQALHQWYLGIYIDAFEWVELPNTLGMSQYADGGLLATKPYVSSAAYIDRMSDYCKGCHYNKKQRTGPQACPFNALYWDFLERNQPLLATNYRLLMPYKQLQRFTPEQRDQIAQHSAAIRSDLEVL